MNILIVGMGEVGLHLARVLSEERHSVTVIDPDTVRIQRVGEADVQVVLGDATHPHVLDEADAATADLVLGVSDSDQVNMLSCYLAKRMGARHSIVRVRDKEHYRRYRSFLRKNLLYDEVLSLEDLAAEEIAKIVRRNRAVAVENFLGGQVTLRVVPVKEDSPLVGKTLKELRIRGLLVVAVERGDDTLIPDGNQDFLPGDLVYVLGRPRDVEDFEAQIGHHRGRTRNVVIFGSSNVSFQATRLLERHGLKLRLFCDDHDRSLDFAERLSDQTQVLHVDGVDLEFFKEGHVGIADAFVGASASDEQNLLTCQLARELGCERTIALVSRPDYSELYNVIGITKAVAPRVLCSNAIVNHVQAGKLRFLAAIHEGKARVCATTLGHGSVLIGKPLKEAKFPKGCVLAAIQRSADGHEEVLIPTGEDLLREDDSLILFLLTSREKQVFELVSAKAH